MQLSLQQEQSERREEELHHKEMLMELQSLLARERDAKEDISLKVLTLLVITYMYQYALIVVSVANYQLCIYIFINTLVS